MANPDRPTPVSSSSIARLSKSRLDEYKAEENATPVEAASNRRSGLTSCQRNVTFVLGVSLMLCGGTPYMVSLFTHVLKSRLGYSETETMLVETCTHVGLYCGITQGIVYDRWGLRAEGLLASVMIIIGYVGLFNVTDGSSRPSPAAVGILFFMVGQASHGFYTMAAMTNIRNFSTTNKGKVMGVLAAMFALSGAVFTPIAGAFGLRTSSGSGNLTAAYACNPAHADESEAEGEYGGDSGPIFYFLFVAVLTGVVGLVGAAFMRREDSEKTSDTTPLMQELLPVGDDGLALMSDIDNSYLTDDSARKLLEPGCQEVPEVDLHGLSLLRDIRFILLFICMAIEDGTAVMFSNGLSSMRGAAHSENPDLPQVPTLLVLFALGSCFGRAIWGFVADKFYEHRAAVLLCTMVGMFFSSLLMTVFPSELVVGTVFISFCFGGMFAIAPVICAEQFGARHFGTNWGCVVFAPALGSVGFSSLFGQLYEKSTAEGCENCEGTQCYQQTFVVTTAFLAIGVLLNIGLVLKVQDAAVGVKVGGLIPIIAPKPPPIFTQENIEQKLFRFD